ncbi:MAG: TonB-dependent receptor [Saprospiraceae bacterium]|nr:TonB-dependent receptor [Saprospiraceae bacterium]
MKNILFLICILASLTNLSSQADIRGTVIDKNNENLISATVVLLSEADSTMVSFSLTNEKGEFAIKRVKEGDYLLQITYLGYDQFTDKVIVRKEDAVLELGAIILKQASTNIEEVIIEGERTPILVKDDTLEYNADAFKTQPNDVVEDLLKRLPGVEVESDGSIKAQGEDVQKVLVDGKKFFGDDPKIATRNLPADAVEKVQIYDKQSDMAEFSGVDDGEREKTINLELKEDRKKGNFGSLTAGYGTDDRYLGNLSFNRFNNKMQFSTIGNFNNTNQQGFSVNDYVSFMGGMGGFMGGGRGGMNIPISNGLSSGFVTTNAGGLNFNYDFSDKTDLSVSYFLNDIENEVDQLTIRENFLAEGSYITDNNSDQISNSTGHRFNLELNHEIDSSQDLRLRTGLSINNGDLESGSLSRIFDEIENVENEVDNIYNSNGEKTNPSGSLLYRKKFGQISKSTLTLRAAINSTDNLTDADLNSDITDYPNDPILKMTEQIVQQQLQNDDQLSYSFNGSFVRPIWENKFIEFKYNRQNYNEEILRDVYDDINNDLILNDNLSSHYTRDYVYDRLAVALHMNSEVTQLTVEGALQNSAMDGDVISRDILIENNVFRFLPRVSFRHELGQSHNIRLRYNTSVNEPSLTQLQPVFDNTDPQNIYIGNPDLVPEYRHNLRLHYINYDQFSFRSIFAFLSASYTKNDITNQTIKEQGTQIRQSINVDYNLSLNGSFTYATPIRSLGIKTNIRTRLGYGNGPIFLNDLETMRNSYNGNVRLLIENRNKSTIDWNLGGSWGYNINNYADNENAGQEYFNQSLFADFTYNIKNSISFETGISVDFYSEEAFGEEQIIPIWTASISKFILANQRGEIKFSVFDILNQNLGISRTSTLNYIENSEILSLGQYFMLSFTYALKPMGGTGSKSGNSRRR